ncbi:MAG: heavy metal translocating P-type ATPase, partial [Ferruginibacter sp.]
KNEEKSFIHPWSRYFTYILLSIAGLTLIFWSLVDPTKILPAVTSVLIVACPCSLLLSATFTYGNMLRIFGRNKLYLKNAAVIEALAKINAVVFDKTGTITQSNAARVNYEGCALSGTELAALKAVTRQSSHPLSKIIAASIHNASDMALPVNSFAEYSGRGLDAVVAGIPVKMGSADFIYAGDGYASHDTGTSVHVQLGKKHMGKFSVQNQYREGVAEMIQELKGQVKDLYVLSGDNDSEKENLSRIFGPVAELRFNQSPQQKLDFIKYLQKNNGHVLMLGDGLNDAGALMQSQVGIAVSDNSARFSPASDAILDGNKVSMLGKFVRYARAGKNIVLASFILSILYNIVGLSFAVQGILSPMIAAILMPASSISIVLFVSLCSSLVARKKGL